jgi:hypothetical protein
VYFLRGVAPINENDSSICPLRVGAHSAYDCYRAGSGVFI